MAEPGRHAELARHPAGIIEMPDSSQRRLGMTSTAPVANADMNNPGEFPAHHSKVRLRGLKTDCTGCCLVVNGAQSLPRDWYSTSIESAKADFTMSSGDFSPL